MKANYDDIINMPHHVSKTRAQMSMIDRAAQFSPFAALTGYGDAIDETGRWTDRKLELSEDEKEHLDRTQQMLLEKAESQPEIEITYFKKDAKKQGGEYVTVCGKLKKINEEERVLMLLDGMQIPLDDIWELQEK